MKAVAKTRFNSFKYLVRQGFSGLWFNRVNSFASFCVVTISLLMVGISVLVSFNITKMIGAIESRNEVIVVISDGAPENNIDILGEQLRENQNVFEVNFYSRDDAWADMQEGMSEEEKSLFQYMSKNPLPDCYRIRVSDISELSKTVAAIQNLEFVEQVQAPNDFANILIGIRNVCTILFSAVTISLIVVCFVIISNSTRASVYARRREINIMRYVGASKSFVEIPFFVEGLVIGLLSAGVAYGLTWLAYKEIFKMFSTDVNMLSIFGLSALIPFEQIAIRTAIAYAVAGIALSAIGTVISTRKHLKA